MLLFMKRKFLPLICLLLVHVASIARTKNLEVKFHGRAYYDVFAYQDNGDSINLTKFDSWISIKDLKISPDSSYFFFRYKEEGKAYRLVTYHFDSLYILKEIVPGYGGSFDWNEKNQILHSWGCGTNCANLRVYNKELNEIFFTLSSGGFEFSPNKTKVAQLNMQYDQIWIFDLKTLDENHIPHGYTQKLDLEINWDIYRFETNELIIFNKQPKNNLNLLKINWVKLNPETIGQFYRRTWNE